jgi:hypothetical protein
MFSSLVQIRLELIAAKAKQLAADNGNNRIWPDDLVKGLNEVQEQLTLAIREAKSIQGGN